VAIAKDIVKEIVKEIVKAIEKAKGSFFDILKRILEKLENKNSFKKKRDVLKTTQNGGDLSQRGYQRGYLGITRGRVING